MKHFVKVILLSIASVLFVAYFVGVGVWLNRRPNEVICPGLVITISDYNKRQYLTIDEVGKLLRGKGLNPVGNSVSSVSTTAIEDVVRSHPLVRQAECYITRTGMVHVVLSQRVPVLLVVTDKDSYFVDTKRKRVKMHEEVSAPILFVTGYVSENMAENELMDMALWLRDNRYWKDKIELVYVMNPRMIQLIQKKDGTRIILGEIDGYQRKLNKLRILYEKGFEQMGWQTYREIDLRFKGQVVGRK